MSKCYKKSFLKKVIARIDFTSKIDTPVKGLEKESSEKILMEFPIPEPREIITRQVQLSEGATKEITDTQNHLIYHSNNRDKSICITPEFAYLEILKYSTSDLLKKDFNLLLDVLSAETEFSANRFGLRFINEIELDEAEPLSWGKYINDDLLSGFNIADDKKNISRNFSNIVQKFDNDLQISFQYGMHNPDYPSKIKKKIYILDIDAFMQGVMEKEVIQDEFDIAHNRIEFLFEKPIKQDLRERMEEMHE